MSGARPRLPDLVIAFRLETAIDLNTAQTKHIYTEAGTTVRNRTLKNEIVWERRQKLGAGAFGTVWLEEFVSSTRPRRRDIQQVRAVKEIRKMQGVSTQDLDRELEAIAKFSHEKFSHCFVRSFGWYENETSLFIAMEYLKYGDLQQYLSRPFPEEETRQVSVQLTEALSIMHEHGFVHRDLKPGNILVFQRGPSWWIKLSDFGIARRVEGTSGLTTVGKGTEGYMAPEVHGISDEDSDDESESADHRPTYNSAVDLWAVGEIVHRMMTNQACFSTLKQLITYVTKRKAFPQTELERVGASPQCIGFVQSLMAAVPRNRPTAKQAMSDEWLLSHSMIEDVIDGQPEDCDNEYDIIPRTLGGVDEPSAQWSTLGTSTEYTLSSVDSEPTTSSIMPGQCLPLGHSLISANGKYKFEILRTGEVSVSTIGNYMPAILFNWYPPHITFDGEGAMLVLTRSGALEMRDANGRNLWSEPLSRLIIDSPHVLILRDDGNLVVQLMSRNGLPGEIAWALPRPSGDRLETSQELWPNQRLRSPNGVYELVFQLDCNFVLYRYDNPDPMRPTGYRAIWASGWWVNNITMGKAILQNDGNLVVYEYIREGMAARWASGTFGPRPVNYVLIMQDDGDAVIYDGDRVVWSTGTAGR